MAAVGVPCPSQQSFRTMATQLSPAAARSGRRRRDPERRGICLPGAGCDIGATDKAPWGAAPVGESEPAPPGAFEAIRRPPVGPRMGGQRGGSLHNSAFADSDQGTPPEAATSKLRLRRTCSYVNLPHHVPQAGCGHHEHFQAAAGVHLLTSRWLRKAGAEDRRSLR